MEMTPNVMIYEHELYVQGPFLDKKEPECRSGVFQRVFQLRKITVRVF